MTFRADAEAIVEIERCAMRAVPTTVAAERDGWLLTAGSGVVQRTNSVTTFGSRPADFAAAVAAAGRWYSERGLPLRFRLTDLDPELDTLLDDRGLDRSVDVAVMTADLGDAAGTADADLDDRASPDWLDALGRLAGHGADRTDELAAGLGALDLPHGAFRVGELPSPAAGSPPR